MSNELPFIEYLRSSLLKPLIDLCAPLDNVAWISDALQNVLNLFDLTVDAHRQGKPIVWNEYALLSELFLAMDIVPFPAETLGFISPMLQGDLIHRFIDKAEEVGIPPELCSLDKTLIGCHLLHEMPNPTFTLSFSTPCDSAVGGYQVVEELTGVPAFHIDIPPDHDDRARHYIAGQIKELITFTERQTNRTLDVDALRQRIAISNRMLEILLDNNEYRRQIPCPGTGKLLTYQFMILVATHGLEGGIRYQEIIRERYDKNVKLGRFPTDKENIRILWPAIPTLFDLDIHNWMEEEFGAVVAMDLVGCIFFPFMDTASLDTMVDGLASKIMNYNMIRHVRGGLDLIFSDVFNLYEAYKCDGIIFPNHMGCKHIGGFICMLRKETAARGIPLLVFDIDGADSRVTPPKTIKNHIEEFFYTHFSDRI
jgi:benzoyl-CoA reductase/2-hydroxyglutaryl-CoA dehydratase subunit BcrC/BadD/HgdB